jgi:hypothetical protein
MGSKSSLQLAKTLSFYMIRPVQFSHIHLHLDKHTGQHSKPSIIIHKEVHLLHVRETMNTNGILQNIHLKIVDILANTVL